MVKSTKYAKYSQKAVDTWDVFSRHSGDHVHRSARSANRSCASRRIKSELFHQPAASQTDVRETPTKEDTV